MRTGRRLAVLALALALLGGTPPAAAQKGQTPPPPPPPQPSPAAPAPSPGAIPPYRPPLVPPRPLDPERRPLPPGASRVPLPTHLSHQVLVVLKPGAAATAEADLARDHQLTGPEPFALASLGMRVLLYRVADARDVAALARQLDGDPRVSFAQPNFRYRTQQSPSGAPQYALRKIRADEAHAVATGRGVVIALVDTGVDVHHPALRGRIAEQVEIGEPRLEPEVHGTGLAGVLAAEGTVRGVAPAARLIAIRAFTSNPLRPGEGVSATDRLARGLDAAIERRAQVINLSAGGPADRLITLVVQHATRRGIVVVAAAGNGGPGGPAVYPAALEEVIAVTAIDARDRLYPEATRGRYIAVAAPGVDVLTTAPGDSYHLMSGTSIAAAHVSGVVALLLEKQPALEPARVKALLRKTAPRLGSAGPTIAYGAVDAVRALEGLTGRIAR